MPNTQDLQQPLKIGEELTQYKIKKVLGRGGFGITYLAMDLNLERQVVIKEFFPREQVMRSSGSEIQVLSSGSGNSLYQNSLKKFLAEGRTLAKFRHNNIALVLTAFPENNTAYLVMEYNKGEDLAEFIKKRKKALDFTQIKKLFLPICKGLQALHKQDLLHLDISPDNIYLPDKGEPYLIDFGGVRQFVASKDVSASFMVLKEGYAPAEQHSNTSKLGFYSDIYALGMTLYYALTLEAKLPLSTDRQNSLFEGDDDPLPLLADSIITKNYPKDFVSLIEQAIQPNRKHRLQKIDDLISVLEGNKIKNKKAKPAQANNHQVSKQNSPLPIKKIIIGLVVLMFVGLGVWQINNYQQEQAKIKQADAALYKHARTAPTISNYESYLGLCKLCEYKERAQAQIDIIKQQKQEQQQDNLLIQQAQQNNTVESYINYVDNCSLCDYIQQAKIQVKNILRDTAEGLLIFNEDSQWLKEIKQELSSELFDEIALQNQADLKVEQERLKQADLAEQQRQADLKAEQIRQMRLKEKQLSTAIIDNDFNLVKSLISNNNLNLNLKQIGYDYAPCGLAHKNLKIKQFLTDSGATKDCNCSYKKVAKWEKDDEEFFENSGVSHGWQTKSVACSKAKSTVKFALSEQGKPTTLKDCRLWAKSWVKKYDYIAYTDAKIKRKKECLDCEQGAYGSFGWGCDGEITITCSAEFKTTDQKLICN